MLPGRAMGACGVTDPHDLDSERATLGGLILGGHAEGLQGTDFYRPGHQLVYEAIEGLRSGSKPVSAISVADELRRRGTLNRVGGAPYVHTLIEAAPSAAQASYYGAIVRELAERRHLIEHAERLRQAALSPGADIDDVRALAARTAQAGTPGVPGMPRVTRLADVEPERIEWLWSGYLPLGKPVVIDGDPGVGKSTVCLDLAARVTTGSPMPDGSSGIKGTVLVLSAEDGVADTIRPRLDAAGADPAQVITVTQIGEGPAARPVVIPGDLPAIEAVVAAHEVKLVIVDVLMAYLTGDVNAHRDQDIRRALHVLSAMAERTGCCVIILRHLNKSGGGNAIYRGGGSIGIIGAARAGFMCGRDPDDETGARRIFANVKMNIAAEPPSLAYVLAYDELHDVGRVQWLGSSEHRAGDLLGDGREQDDAPNALDDAVGWLQKYLMDCGGQHDSKDVKVAARKERISDRTLKRALKPAGVTVRSEGFPRKTVWSIDPNASRASDTVKGPTGPTGSDAEPFQQVAHSGASEAAPIGAKQLGLTDDWPEGSIGEAGT